MASEYPSMDVGDSPDLLKLAEDVNRTNKPRVLRRAGEDIAVVVPARKRAARSSFKKRSQEDIDAAWSAFGSWKDED